MILNIDINDASRKNRGPKLSSSRRIVRGVLRYFIVPLSFASFFILLLVLWINVLIMAEEAWERGDNSKALALYKPLAWLGDSEAQKNGWTYLCGTGATDFQRMIWLRYIGFAGRAFLEGGAKMKKDALTLLLLAQSTSPEIMLKELEERGKTPKKVGNG